MIPVWPRQSARRLGDEIPLQTWLGVSNDAAATVSDGYCYQRQRRTAAQEARDPALQDQLMDKLAALTGIWLLMVSPWHQGS